MTLKLILNFRFHRKDEENLKVKSISPLVVEEENDAVQILSLQIDHNDLNQSAIETESILKLNDKRKNGFQNATIPTDNLKPSYALSINDDQHLNKENQFVINKAKIEIQTVEAVQMNLDSVKLFTCEFLENLEKDKDNLDCFCLTHDAYERTTSS